MNADSGISGWAKDLFSALKITPDDEASLILDKAEQVANDLAPNTRRLWNVILFFQGIAVLAPLFWFMVVRERWEVPFTAYGVVFCTVAVVLICWYVRWRGMQHAWARARMVAEIARSETVTAQVAPQATAQALKGAPYLSKVASRMSAHLSFPGTSLEQRRTLYRELRIEDQLNYYRLKRKQAVKERKGLSKVVTLSLDAALFLSVAGLAVSLRDGADRWLDWSSSDYFLGFMGTALPLIAILAQLRGAYLELNRRVGRYAQQIEYLDSTLLEISRIQGNAELENMVAETERTLLGEVVEWYYQVEHTEPYYRARQGDTQNEELTQLRGRRAGLFPRVMGAIGFGAGFIGKVLFGRLLVVAISVVLTTALIHYKRAPDDPSIHSTLRLEDGLMLSPEPGKPYTPWAPKPEYADNGFFMIVHGLRNGVDFEATGDNWMTRFEVALREQLGPDQPDICLVDWHVAARPSDDIRGTLDSSYLQALGLPPGAYDMMNDLSMIRPQGERIGELVGFKLARAIRNGSIRRDRPMHLVGHSAGGFVVLNAAIVLQELGLAPDTLRVTMLDTPLPVKADILKIAHEHPVDYYATSTFAQMVPADGFTPGFRRFSKTPPEGVDPYIGAHSFAYTYYIHSIRNPNGEDGFSLSPFSKGN